MGRLAANTSLAERGRTARGQSMRRRFELTVNCSTATYERLVVVVARAYGITQRAADLRLERALALIVTRVVGAPPLLARLLRGPPHETLKPSGPRGEREALSRRATKREGACRAEGRNATPRERAAPGSRSRGRGVG